MNEIKGEWIDEDDECWVTWNRDLEVRITEDVIEIEESEWYVGIEMTVFLSTNRIISEIALKQ